MQKVLLCADLVFYTDAHFYGTLQTILAQTFWHLIKFHFIHTR